MACLFPILFCELHCTLSIVCGVDENGHRDIIAVEPMTEESKDTYGILFQKLKDRGLSAPKLIISDAHSGLVAAIQASRLSPILCKPPLWCRIEAPQ